mgnify:CR=1 FL=1
MLKLDPPVLSTNVPWFPAEYRQWLLQIAVTGSEVVWPLWDFPPQTLACPQPLKRWAREQALEAARLARECPDQWYWAAKYPFILYQGLEDLARVYDESVARYMWWLIRVIFAENTRLDAWKWLALEMFRAFDEGRDLGLAKYISEEAYRSVIKLFDESIWDDNYNKAEHISATLEERPLELTEEERQLLRDCSVYSRMNEQYIRKLSGFLGLNFSLYQAVLIRRKLIELIKGQDWIGFWTWAYDYHSKKAEEAVDNELKSSWYKWASFFADELHWYLCKGYPMPEAYCANSSEWFCA